MLGEGGVTPGRMECILMERKLDLFCHVIYAINSDIQGYLAQ